MTEPRSPLDAALDLLVYVPVGLALTASEEIPKLAAKGRAQLGGRVSMAKVVGQFVVAQGRKEVSRRLSAGTVSSRAAPPSPPVSDRGTVGGGVATAPVVTGEPVIRPAPGAPAAPAVTFEDLLASADRAEGGFVDEGGPPAGERGGAATSAGAEGVDASPGSEALAIPGYDSLAASQVVQRLAGLAADELAAVGAYESSHRGRRTILTRVRQLQQR